MPRPKYDVLPPFDPFAAEWQRAAAYAETLLTPQPTDDRQFVRCTCTHCGYILFVRPSIIADMGLPLCPAGVSMRAEKGLPGRKKRR